MHTKLRFTLLFFIVLFVSFTVKAQETITNKQILDMTNAHLSKDIIIKKIHQSKPNFDTLAETLISLGKAGVDNEVISAMLDAQPVNANAVTTSTPKTTPAPTVTPNPAVNATTTPTPTPQTSTTPVTTSSSANNVCLQAKLSGQPISIYTDSLCSLVKNVADTNNRNHEILFDQTHTFILGLLSEVLVKGNKIVLNDAAKNKEAIDLFVESDKNRNDKQVGSNPSSSGTTSLAVKGGAPSVIGAAIEQGAATSSINGNTVTIRVNPFGLYKALQGEGFLGSNFLNNIGNAAQNISNNSISTKSTNNGNQSNSDFLRKFSIGFSFDTTRGQSTPTFIVSKQQLSAVSARYEFINQRTPQSKKAQILFNKFVPDVSDILNKEPDIFRSLADNFGNLLNKPLQNWINKTNSDIKIVPTSNGTPEDQSRYEEDIRVVIEKDLATLPIDDILKDQTAKKAFENFIDLTLDYQKKREAFIKEVNKGTVASFEYTNFREPIAPDTSNFNFIVENGHFLSTPKISTDLTFNASLTMYNKKPTFTGVKRIRDFQFTLQTDTSLGKAFGEDNPNTILTFAGKYERLNGDTVSPLGVVMRNSKGDIATGQIKLTIPIGNSGVKLPLSMTFANRSDLIKEKVVRGNFGITFDLDSIFANQKP